MQNCSLSLQLTSLPTAKPLTLGSNYSFIHSTDTQGLFHVFVEFTWVKPIITQVNALNTSCSKFYERKAKSLMRAYATGTSFRWRISWGLSRKGAFWLTPEGWVGLLWNVGERVSWAERTRSQVASYKMVKWLSAAVTGLAGPSSSHHTTSS